MTSRKLRTGRALRSMPRLFRCPMTTFAKFEYVPVSMGSFGAVVEARTSGFDPHTRAGESGPRTFYSGGKGPIRQ
jgi:hypothetical protein